MLKRILMSGIGVVLGCAPLDGLSAHSEEWGEDAPADPPRANDEASGTEGPNAAPGADDDGEPAADPGDVTASDDGAEGAQGEAPAAAVPLDPGSVDEVPGTDDAPEAPPDSDAMESEPVAPDPPAEPSIPLVRFVRLVADSEVEGLPYTSVAELGLIGADGAELPDPGSWVASADSAESVYVGGAAAGFAIDGDPETLWHTAWSEPPVPPHPHFLQLDLGVASAVTGFRYLPRQTAETDGRILDYRFYVSADGQQWGEPVASGRFPNVAAEQIVTFEPPTP